MTKLHKLINYEYWPWYIWHGLALPIHIYNAVKCRTLVYFTVLNPAMGNSGGFFGDSKLNIGKTIPSPYRLNEIMLDVKANIEQQLLSNDFQFPVVLKPDAGERGEGVVIINSAKEIIEYLNKYGNGDYGIIAQEYCESTNEYGIFMINHPQKGWFISGITGKIPLHIMGDGKHTLLDLLAKNKRYKMQIGRLLAEGKFDLQKVYEEGEIIVVEKILNHRLGTQFTNETTQLDTQLQNALADVVKDFKGFNYGRFDIKADNLNQIKQGNFKIIELNGVASEPTIIYDQKNTGLLKSISIIYKHLFWQGVIAKNQLKNGVLPMDWALFKSMMKNHFNLNWHLLK